MTDRQCALIGGAARATADWFGVLDPATEAVIAQVARCMTAEVDAAVAAAAEAAPRWRRMTAADRGRICRAMADVLGAHRAELAELESLDTGKPLRQAYADADAAARYFEFYGSSVEALYGQTVMSAPDRVAFTVLNPHGVSAHIIPWNYPLQLAARTLAPALAAGNTCVLKPAEDAPLTPLRIGELAAQAGFPPGVINVVPGLGAEAGAALAGHRGIGHLAFTGSVPVGRQVGAAAARNIVPSMLELGGKSPQIVFSDADLDHAVDTITASIIEHAGQNCSAGSRVLAHQDVQAELTRRLAERFAAVTIGPGRAEPDLGPLISARQRDRVLNYIDVGLSEARLVTGGEPVPGPGFFVRPALFDAVPPQARIAREEIFGPVLCVLPFRSAAEAVTLANGTGYGLSVGIWTKDAGLAFAVAGEVRAGHVFINGYSAAAGVELPFGGYAQSGYGGEKGFAAFGEYTRITTIAVGRPAEL
jgi:aldehyde dehydrogenase (NAD+)/betaine-aldehyde dehydrogenase